MSQPASALDAAFQALHEIAVAASGVLDPDQLARLVVDRARELVGADSATLIWSDDQDGPFRLVSDREPSVQSSPVRVDLGVRARVYRDRAAVVVDDYASWDGALPHLVERGVRSAAGVPLLVGDHMLGVLVVDSNTHGRFDTATTEVLELLAAQVAPALEAARLYRESERQRVVNLALAELVREAALEPDLDSVLGLVSEAGMSLLAADYCGARLRGTPGRDEVHGVRGNRVDWNRPRQFAGAGLVNRAISERRSLVFEHCDQLPESDLGGLHLYHDEGAHTLLITPLMTQGDARGALIVGWRHDHTPSPGEVALAETLAHFAASVVENVGAHQTAEAHARAMTAHAAALARASERLQTIYDAIGCGIVVREEDGAVVHFNAAAAEISGLPVEELRKLRDRAPWQTLELVGPEIPHEPLHAHVRRTGKPLRKLQSHIRLTSGEERWVRLDVVPLGGDHGGVPELVFSFVDISEVKAAEQQLAEQATILQHLSEAVVVLDLAGAIIYWNDGAAALFGYTAAEIVGQPPAVLFPSPPAAPLDLARAEVTGYGGEWQGRHKDGRLVWVQVQMAPLYDAVGVQRGVVGIASDLTEQKRLAEELAQAQRLETAGRLAGQVAHDFNNLLAPLRGFPELIRQRLPVGHPAVAYCELMEQAAGRMAEINEDLLTLGQRGQAEQVALELGPLVRQTLSGLALPPTVALTVELEPSPLVVRGTAGQLQRVLANLALNGRDALGAGGGPLMVRLDRVEVAAGEAVGQQTRVPTGSYARLAVEDGGGGIAPEVAGRMFEAFYTTKTPGGGGSRVGSGLGLSIVRTVVGEHGGYLDWTSAEGVGTCFTVYLPLLVP